MTLFLCSSLALVEPSRDIYVTLKLKTHYLEINLTIFCINFLMLPGIILMIMNASLRCYGVLFLQNIFSYVLYTAC
jgi:hypothetical protein